MAPHPPALTPPQDESPYRLTRASNFLGPKNSPIPTTYQEEHLGACLSRHRTDSLPIHPPDAVTQMALLTRPSTQLSTVGWKHKNTAQMTRHCPNHFHPKEHSTPRREFRRKGELFCEGALVVEGIGACRRALRPVIHDGIFAGEPGPLGVSVKW